MKKALFAILAAVAVANLSAAEFSSVIIPPEPRAKLVKSGKKHWWQSRLEAKKKQAQREGKKIDIVFVGDSITHFWERNAANKAVFNEFFGKYNVLNLGFSGDRTRHARWVVEESGVMDGLEPRLIVVLIGTNNIGWKESDPKSTAEDIGNLVSSLRRKAADAKIVVFGIFPRGKTLKDRFRVRTDKVNAMLPSLADNKTVFYVDISDGFTDDKGLVIKQLMPDFLHPSPEGYRIWGKAVAPFIERFVAGK